MRLFNAYVTNIFMYNTEIWTLTKKLENSIDVFQRKLLRFIINRFYPKNISNIALYKITKQTPWTSVIKTRRLRWTGHMLRMNPEVPCNRALSIYKTHNGKLKRRNFCTWIGQMNKYLQSVGVDGTIWDTGVRTLAADREPWRKVVDVSACYRELDDTSE